MTWALHALIHNLRGGEMMGLWGLSGGGENDSGKMGLWLTIILGVLFSSIQAYEYSDAPFPTTPGACAAPFIHMIPPDARIGAENAPMVGHGAGWRMW